MDLTDSTVNNHEIAEKIKEIYNFVDDKRILRALLESNILELRDIQKEAIKKGLFFHKSFLICAPSGSGKTLIAELCSVYNVFRKYGKSAYLIPYKADAYEKFRQFQRRYKKYGVKIVLSVGDYDADDSKLEKADIIITTYEKMDSILRNFLDKDWIFSIKTITIDEVHSISEESRGPRLESLIVRLSEILRNPQLICLSATIANPEDFNGWLNSLGNSVILIKSYERPVKLEYNVLLSQNRTAAIKRLVRDTLINRGQILIFVNRRIVAFEEAFRLRNIVVKSLSEKEKLNCKKISYKIKKLKGFNVELRKLVKYGIVFHHAGLLPREKKIIEDGYRNHDLKVICCTTTLASGINVPARVVILKEFKRFIISGHEVKNFFGLYECGDGFRFFKPFSQNEVFQMLGRAGRPGLDDIGLGYILVSSLVDKAFVEDMYFNNYLDEKNRSPRYNNLVSELDKTEVLKEQVLLRIYEEKSITLDSLKLFFEKTFFWYSLKKKMLEQDIPILQLLMINEITPLNILRLHCNSAKLESLRKSLSVVQIKISEISNIQIIGHIKSQLAGHTCSFNIDLGIKCSCGFQNGISDNFSNQKIAFEFCDHVSMFLLYLVSFSNANLRKYVDDIIPRSVKNQYILSYLLDKGLIKKVGKDTIKCTQFGKLIIRLYLYPTSAILIKRQLEESEINTYQDIINVAYNVLKAEYKVKGDKILDSLKDWIDEISLDQILKAHNVLAGDLRSAIDNITRIIVFTGVIASYLSTSGLDVRNKMIKVSEMCEKLKLRIRFGVKEELFNLVLNVKNIGRIRGRLLYDAGYKTTSQIAKESCYKLNSKTGFGIDFCKKIIKSIALESKTAYYD